MLFSRYSVFKNPDTLVSVESEIELALCVARSNYFRDF